MNKSLFSSCLLSYLQRLDSLATDNYDYHKNESLILHNLFSRSFILIILRIESSCKKNMIVCLVVTQALFFV